MRDAHDGADFLFDFLCHGFVLFKKIAHIVLGHTKEGTMTDSEHTPRDTREVEAESVAYILCSLLNLPGLTESRGYIQGWLAGNEISDKSAQKIFAAATKILDAGKLSTEDGQ